MEKKSTGEEGKGERKGRKNERAERERERERESERERLTCGSEWGQSACETRADQEDATQRGKPQWMKM